MGGGPSQLQKQQAAEAARLNQQMVELGNRYDKREQAAYDEIAPFARGRLEGGLPYFNLLTDAQGGLTARAFAPARASLNRMFSVDGLPSGSKNAAMRGLDAEQARAFDDGLRGAVAADDAARVQGAELLRGQQVLSNPMQAYGTASQGFRGIYDSQNLRSSGVGGILGGIAGSALGGLMGNPNVKF